MNEPLGIALELAARRKALAARMSPQARRLAFPDVYRVEEERRAEIKYRIKKIKSDWSAGKHVTALEKAKALEPHTRLIVSVCARVWGVPANLVYDAVKAHCYVLPRRAAMGLMRSLLKMSLPSIGHSIGGRDHTTVKYALAKHEEFLIHGLDYARKYDEAEAEVRAVFLRNGVISDTTPADDEVDGRTERPSHPSSAHLVEREAA